MVSVCLGSLIPYRQPECSRTWRLFCNSTCSEDLWWLHWASKVMDWRTKNGHRFHSPPPGSGRIGKRDSSGGSGHALDSSIGTCPLIWRFCCASSSLRLLETALHVAVITRLLRLVQDTVPAAIFLSHTGCGFTDYWLEIASCAITHGCTRSRPDVRFPPVTARPRTLITNNQ